MRVSRVLTLPVLVLAACCLLSTAERAVAQSDAFAATDPNNPIKLLVDNLNSPAGATLRARWNIDGASWHEPVAVTDSTGAARLVTPAYGEIHVSSVPFGYPSCCAMPTNPSVPSKVRCLVPRTYGTNSVDRLIMVAPTNVDNENNFDGRTKIQAPLLRKGYLMCAQNSYNTGEGPTSYADFPRRLNQSVGYAHDLLFGTNGLGLVAPRYTYGYGYGRGGQALTYAIQEPNNPFDGVDSPTSEAWSVPRLNALGRLLKQLHAVNPADEAAMAEYFKNIGRNMTITTANGTPKTGVISAVLNADYRSFFKIPATAQIKFPSVPGFDSYGIDFVLGPAAVDNMISGNPTVSPPVLSLAAIRWTLLDVDPSFIADVDAGTVLLRDWDPAKRSLDVQRALAVLTPTGVLNRTGTGHNTKMLKVNGSRDLLHSVVEELNLIRKFITAGSGENLRYYFDFNSGNSTQMVEETSVSPTAVATSLGWKLNDLDALIGWVETGVEPGDIMMRDSTDVTSTLEVAVPGAHQYGFQNKPDCYFRQIEGLPLVTWGPTPDALGRIAPLVLRTCR